MGPKGLSMPSNYQWSDPEFFRNSFDAESTSNQRFYEVFVLMPVTRQRLTDHFYDTMTIQTPPLKLIQKDLIKCCRMYTFDFDLCMPEVTLGLDCIFYTVVTRQRHSDHFYENHDDTNIE